MKKREQANNTFRGRKGAACPLQAVCLWKGRIDTGRKRKGTGK